MTNNDKSFADKVAFITGGASGIGRATALTFARAGASVAVADVSEKGNQETARLIEQENGRAIAVRCDVSRSDEVQTALNETIAAFGWLDFAFNNAGIEPRKPAPTADYDEEEWNRIIDIDLRGVFLCINMRFRSSSSREAARSSTPPPGQESSASRAARPTRRRNTASSASHAAWYPLAWLMLASNSRLLSTSAMNRS